MRIRVARLCQILNVPISKDHEKSRRNGTFSYEKKKKEKRREKGKRLILKFTSTVNTIHGARERLVALGTSRRAPAAAAASRREEIFAWHATTFSQSTRVSQLNRTEALLNRQYGRATHWNAVMHRYICMYIYTWRWAGVGDRSVVSIAHLLGLKQTIGMQGERGLSIQALDGMQKKPTFPDKRYRHRASLTEWKSSWFPLFACRSASSPLKTRLGNLRTHPNGRTRSILDRMVSHTSFFIWTTFFFFFFFFLSRQRRREEGV